MEFEDDKKLFDIDFEVPLFRDDIVPRILSFCPLRTICDIRCVSKDFFRIAHHTPIYDTLYCHGDKPVKRLLDEYKFKSVVVNNSEAFDLFIDSLDHNHCIHEVSLSSRIYNISLRKIRKLASKKSLRVMSVNGVQDFKFLSLLTKNSSLTELTVRKNGTHKLKTLFEAIDGGKKLKKLILLEVQPLDDPGWEHVFKETFIEELQVLKGKGPNLRTDKFLPFMKGVQQMYYLKTFVLEGFFMVDPEYYLDGVCKALEVLHFVKYLSLIRMSIGDVEYKKLQKSVERAESLEVFRISWNSHEVRTLKEIAFLIRRLPKLREVSCVVRDHVVDDNYLEWTKAVNLIIESITHSNVVKMSVINKSVSAADDDVYNLRIKLNQELYRNQKKVLGFHNF